MRNRQQTGAECYGTSAHDRNTTSGSTGSKRSTSQVTGSTFLPSTGFRIVDLRVQMSKRLAVGSLHPLCGSLHGMECRPMLLTRWRHYATVDRQLELIGAGRRPVEVDDRHERAADEQASQHQRRDDACRCSTGQLLTSSPRSSSLTTTTISHDLILRRAR